MTSLRSTSPTSAARRIGAALLLSSVLYAPAAAHATVPTTTTTTTTTSASGPCTDETGITVVVDSTELGGDVRTGCADAAATGTEALAAAGFVETRDASGLICAIDALPDPCPTEFTGSYWSYWFAEPGGEWQMYQEGSDTAAPSPGAVEGWRYGTGEAGPTIVAPVAAAATGTEETGTEEPAEEDAVTSEDGADDGTSAAPADQEPATEGGGPSPALLAGLALLAVLALGAVLVARRRSAVSAGDGPRGQD